jgi:GNAT superfamily N-acetyltransferase
LSKIKILVRRAITEDGPQWLDLIESLASFEKLQPPDGAARERLMNDAFGSNPRFDVFLAQISDKIVGYAITFETYSSFLALPTLFLEDLFVLPEYRRCGAGSELFRHCVREAYRRNCGRMEWMVLDWNHPAMDFYERVGAGRLEEWLPYRLERASMKSVMGS